MTASILQAHQPTHSPWTPKGSETQAVAQSFYLNLVISLLLIGMFWLPLKMVQINDFLNSESVNTPGKGQVVQTNSMEIESSKVNPDLLEARVVMINATSEEQWAYFDFSRGKQVDIFDPSSLEWDLAFRRGKIITNGGATNKFGKAGVIDMGEVEFDSIDQMPPGKPVVDDATRTSTENPVLVQWYRYNYITHKLTARKNVYAFTTADGKSAKVQFLSFYCADKEAGCIQMKYVYQDNGAGDFLKGEGAVASAPETSTVSDL